MNTNLLITILLAFSTAACAVCIFIIRMIVRDMEEIINNLYRKVDNLQHNEMVLMKKITEMESKKESDLSQAIKNQILANLRERWSRPQIKVQDDDKPLDFPNDHK